MVTHTNEPVFHSEPQAFDLLEALRSAFRVSSHLKRQSDVMTPINASLRGLRVNRNTKKVVSGRDA